MNHTLLTRGPCSAAAALALAVALPLAHAQAQSTEAAPSTLHVIRHMSAREACPTIDEQLPDELWEAWHRLAKPASVLVEFTVEGHRAYNVTPLSGPLQYRRYVRSAIRSLTCDTHDDQAHVVRVNILFVDYDADVGVTRSARVAIDEPAVR